MLGHGTLDPAPRFAQIARRIEQSIQLGIVQLLAHVGGFAQHASQVTLVCHGAFAALLDQMMSGVATDPLRQGDTHRLSHHQPSRLLQVPGHALGIDFQTGNRLLRLLQ